MRKRWNGSLTWTSILIVFVGLLLYTGFKYPKEVRIVPFIVGMPTLILLLVLIVGEFYPGLLRGVEFAIEGLFGGKSQTCDTKKINGEFTGWRPTLTIMAWIILYYGFTFLLGFILVSPIFIALFLIVKAEIKWPAALFYTAISVALLFAGLISVLKVDIWAGAIPAIIPGIIGGSIIPPL